MTTLMRVRSFFLVFLLFAGFLLAGCTSQGGSTATTIESPPSPLSESPTASPTPTSSASTTSTVASSTTAQQQTTTSAPATTQAAVKEFVITAQQFSFSPNTITVSKGDRVRLKITSTDVTHGFSLPDFSVSANLPPGSQQVVEFTADKAGTFNFFCNVFCGSGHGSMSGQLIVNG